MQAGFPDDDSNQIGTLCISRCERLFFPYDIHCDGGANFPDALGLLEKTKGHIATKVLKSWLNGWATSERMHEDIALRCVLGCSDAPDSLSHYVVCPHMFAFQKFIFDGISDDPLIRFGIKSPCISSFKVISCLFSAYHTVKAAVRSGTINVHEETVTGPTLRVIWSVFAEAMAAEAGELRVATRAFSLCKFISFLSMGILPLEELPCANSLPAVNQ